MGRKRTTAALCALTAAALLQPGCAPDRDAGPKQASCEADAALPAAGDADRVVARVDGEAIRAHELDAPLRLALHDLEIARYQLRARRLDALIAARLGRRAPSRADEARVEVLLSPPEPPRLPVGAEGAPTRGASDAAVTIVEFLDFASPHCRRMQPILRRLLEDYPDELRLAVRDLPLPFHRDARRAALAAACAGEQEAYWDYHDLLLQEQTQLAAADLERDARRLALDPERFAACLGSEAPAEAVDGDVRIARALGVRTAPTFFVNGVYLKGPRSYAELARRVDHELGREPRAPEPAPAPASLEQALRALAELEPGDEPPPVPREILPEPDAVLSLRRDALELALRERAQLEGRLRFAPGTHDGRRLLQLAEVAPGDLFDRLALRPQDVLLLVDGEWVTDAHNPLWRALAERPEVTLVVMRGVRRWIFRYVIE